MALSTALAQASFDSFESSNPEGIVISIDFTASYGACGELTIDAMTASLSRTSIPQIVYLSM